MRRFGTLIALVCAAGALLVPAAAQASHGQSLTFEATSDLKDPATRDQAFKDIAALGVHSMRVVLYWHDVAPEPDSRIKPKFDETDPASYDWGAYDPVIEGIKARGWQLLLTVSGPVPQWATNGARDTVTRPSPAEFQKFVHAVATHYGDAGRHLEHLERAQPAAVPAAAVLGPQDAAVAGDLPQALPRRPARAGRRRPGVGQGAAGGDLAARHGQGGGAADLPARRAVPGREVPQDVAGLREGAGGRLRPSRVHHRPGPDLQARPAQRRHHRRALAAADGARSRGKAGAINAHLPLYLTEFGIESTPDPVRGVSLQRQSEYRAISERIAYDNPRVVAFSQYLLRDDSPKPGVPLLARYPGFETGLFTYKGKHKPAYDGFRLPLAVKQSGSKVSLWGLVRPATGVTTASIEVRSGSGSFHPLTTVKTDSRGYFTKSAAFVAGRQWRLVWKAPDGTTFRGSPTRAYK